ncbi:MAG: DUF308 domain-containing protein [Oscillospiraceae bacterium]|nr:DUF308 domain-containing protein [Oscillospiraceae bacterium]
MANNRLETESAVINTAVGAAAPAVDERTAKKAEKAAQKAAKANKKAAKADKKAAKAAKKAQKNAKKKAKAAAKPPLATTATAKKTGMTTSPVRNLIITAIVSILMGVAFIVEPVLVYSYSGYFIGGVLGVIGIIFIIIYFARRPISGVYRSEFCVGLIALLLGAYVAFSGLLTDGATVSILLSTVVKILGVAVALDGILKLQYCLDLARMRFKTWWLALIMAVLGIALGVVTVLGYVYPVGIELFGTKSDSGFASGMMALGIGFCLNGVFDICVMILVAVRNHKANKAEAAAESSALAASVGGGESVDFFDQNTGATRQTAPSAVAASSAPVYQPTPQPEPTPEPVQEISSEPVFQFEEAPVAEPEPDVVLPDPELASPASVPEEE